MDLEAFTQYYLEPIGLGQDELGGPLPQIFKDISVLKITPEETVDNNRNTYTFINKNLDIITMPNEAYLYVTTTNSQSAGALAMTNSVGIPSSAGLIDGFDYLINDTTVCTQNNTLASTLYAVNNGTFATDSTSVRHLGLSNPDVGPINLQARKIGIAGACEWIIPLKYVVPFLKANKILWGVKQTLKITRANLADVLYSLGGAGKVTAADIVITNMELRMPYVKLENQRQLSLWNSMYSNEINRYWLDCDQFQGPNNSNTVSNTNQIFRVTTKGLQNKPRYILLHAVDPDATDIVSKYKPMGFGPKGEAYGDNVNTFRLTKIRIKLNGIFIDNGDVMEFANVSAANAGDAIANDPWANHKDYTRAYDDYCKFFGQYHSKRDSPKSFDEWLTHQLYVFDLNNIDTEQIFASSGNSLIIEIEYSTMKGTSAAGGSTAKFKFMANVLYDKQLSIKHAENRALLTIN